MKAKRRHDLKTNELAQSIESAREFVRTRGNHLMGVAVAVIVVAGLAAYWQHVAAQSRFIDWQTYYDLQTKSWKDDPELSTRVRRLAEQTGDRALARVALQYAARIAWEEAMATDQVNEEKVAEAQKDNEQIISQYGGEAESAYAVGIAHRSLAAIAEARGNSEEARKHYQAILDDSRLEASPVRMLAEEQLADLDKRMVQVPLADAPAPPKPRPTTRPVRRIPTTRPAARRPVTTRPGA